MPVDINTLEPALTPEKTPEQRAAALAAWSDLQARPLGTQAGEAFGMPQNFRMPPARIYVVNHSRTRKWKRLMVAVSIRHGAEDALMYDRELRKLYNTDMVYKQVEQGRDMNRYREEVYPVAVKIRVPGEPDGNGGCKPSYDRVIPPAIAGDAKPVAVEVPEGTWDLYLGNYDRMKSDDPSVIAAERSRLATFWGKRHNPVFKWTDDGEEHPIDNPYGILEFIRVPIVAVTEPIDKQYLTSLDILEPV